MACRSSGISPTSSRLERGESMRADEGGRFDDGVRRHPINGITVDDIDGEDLIGVIGVGEHDRHNDIAVPVGATFP